jgi:hypothetical protein
MVLSDLNARDFADFEPSENIRKIDLTLDEGSTIEQTLSVLKKWRKLSHLTLVSWFEPSVPRFDVLCDFIMGMKHLTYLHLTPNLGGQNCGQLKSLREKVTEFALANRPNFKFETYSFVDEIMKEIN